MDKQFGPRHRCVSCWLQVGVAALLQRFKGKPHFVPTGRTGLRSEFAPLPQPLGARFVLFRVGTPMAYLTLCANHVSRVEATFRIAFNGGVRLFSKQGDELCIRSLHFDGHEHYSRRLNLRRILRDMKTPAEGIEIPDDVALDDAPSDHRKANCQAYDDCQLLQLTDILVSGFRTVLGESMSEAQRRVCAPLAVLAEKWNRGRKGFSNSRWYKGFCISEGRIENEVWQFRDITLPIVPKQRELFTDGR